MENRLGLQYTTHIINFHCHRKVCNEVCKATINLTFLRLQHKRTKVQKIQQVTNNEGKWNMTHLRN